MTSHRRFFIDPGQIEGSTATITGDAVRQIGRVLRLRKGDSISLLDGSGMEHEARITSLSAGSIIAEILGSRNCAAEPRVKLCLAVCLPKGDKIELIVQKCTELGISRLVVASSERSVPRVGASKTIKRLDRWRRIAAEAAEQCARGRVPEIEGIVEFADLAGIIHSSQLALLACEGSGPELLGSVLRDAAPLLAKEGLWEVGPESNPPQSPLRKGGSEIVLIVGPEGGLTDSEARMAIDAGAKPVSLGRRIFRCETAAIAASAIIMCELDYGGNTT